MPKLTDSELVQSIQESPDRQTIALDELPASVSNVLNTEYSESVVLEVVAVPETGYEVSLIRTEGTLIGECNAVYFGENGRILNLTGNNYSGNYGGDRLNRHGHRPGGPGRP